MATGQRRGWAAGRFAGVSALALSVVAEFPAVAQVSQAVEPLAVAPANPAHEWLLYAAIGLGVVNLLLLYLLNRNRSTVAVAADTADSPHSSSRTDRRMDKRKREIDELRQQVEFLSERVGGESAKRLTPAQIQELVRTFVHDELTRSALPGNSSSR